MCLALLDLVPFFVSEHKPTWFEVYEAFPPKYEPRWDRHQLPYGEGGNVSGLGPPRKIIYKEDLVRAQFYKVFFPQDGADSDEVEKVREVFNLMDNQTEALSEKFIAKYQELELTGSFPVDKLFRATVDALEADGVRLLTSSELPDSEPAEDFERTDRTGKSAKKPLLVKGLKDLFTEKSKPDETA